MTTDYKQAFEELAAQVRRLGIVADVQETDEGICFGENFQERQTRYAILLTVSVFRNLEQRLCEETT